MSITVKAVNYDKNCPGCKASIKSEDWWLQTMGIAKKKVKEQATEIEKLEKQNAEMKAKIEAQQSIMNKYFVVVRKLEDQNAELKETERILIQKNSVLFSAFLGCCRDDSLHELTSILEKIK